MLLCFQVTFLLIVQFVLNYCILYSPESNNLIGLTHIRLKSGIITYVYMYIHVVDVLVTIIIAIPSYMYLSCAGNICAIYLFIYL